MIVHPGTGKEPKKRAFELYDHTTGASDTVNLAESEPGLAALLLAAIEKRLGQ